MLSEFVVADVGGASPALGRSSGSVSDGLDGRSLVSVSEVRAVVEDALSDLVGGSVAFDEPLMDAGVDSLGAVELRSAISKRTGLEMPATLVFDYPTPAALVEYVSGLVGDDRSRILDGLSDHKPGNAMESTGDLCVSSVGPYLRRVVTRI